MRGGKVNMNQSIDSLLIKCDLITKEIKQRIAILEIKIKSTNNSIDTMIGDSAYIETVNYLVGEVEGFERELEHLNKVLKMF